MYNGLEIRYSKQALKFLKLQTRENAERIIYAINALPIGDVKKLKGTDELYRLRVGDFRIIFNKQGHIIFIQKIGSRGDVYK